ncbi:hypothetical protein [Sporosarcina koreensis]|uniref:hypothetical protein n=1 Tax=Bacillales TaxID=1385 RepID=UPI0007548301|nr:hypothetical protein [Sporosarcina koreensis]
MAIDLHAFIPHLNEESLSTYWPEFQVGAYALYTDETVYLFHHPAYPGTEQSFVQLPWSEEFAGNTSILFHDYPTAIVQMDSGMDENRLYAVLAHELFHGFQYVKGESRFPDEVLGITYPLVAENVDLRQQERLHLYNAVTATEAEKRKHHLNQFILYREKRAEVIGPYMKYEQLIETVEGPAFYVELNAYVARSGARKDEEIRSSGELLLDIVDSTRHLRRSCYGSGLFICLLLDELYSGWQADFMQSELTLYEYFRKFVESVHEKLVASDSAVDIGELVSTIMNERDEGITDSLQRANYVLTIHGEIRVTGIDPMNIIANGKKVLHQNFVRLKMNEQDYLVQQPVIALLEDSIFRCKHVQIPLNEKPYVVDGQIMIPGVGIIKGRLDEVESNLWL